MAAPGWYPDPSGQSRQRFFDGRVWTENYAPINQAGYQPPDWYADPTGEALRRYWDGRQWTAATDPLSAALTVHRCQEPGDESTAALAHLRSWRIMVAALREDRVDDILAELEGCPECLSLTVAFLANFAASSIVALADEFDRNPNDHRSLALAIAEKQLAEKICEAAKWC